MSSPVMEAALVGLASGLTETLPLSSSAHVALARLLLGAPAAAAIVWMARIGTWLGAATFFGRDALSAAREAARGVLRPALVQETRAGRDAYVIALATGASVVVTLSLWSHVTPWGSDPTLLGGGLLVSAAALGSTFFAPPGDRDVPTAWGALLVGAAQGAAVLPGLSRTAVTLTSLLWLGVRPPRAFELGFLLWLPAGLLSLWLDRGSSPGVPPVALVALAFGLVGAASGLTGLRALVARRALPAFSLYLVPLAVATIAWGYARP